MTLGEFKMMLSDKGIDVDHDKATKMYFSMFANLKSINDALEKSGVPAKAELQTVKNEGNDVSWTFTMQIKQSYFID